MSEYVESYILLQVLNRAISQEAFSSSCSASVQKNLLIKRQQMNI